MAHEVMGSFVQQHYTRPCTSTTRTQPAHTSETLLLCLRLETFVVLIHFLSQPSNVFLHSNELLGILSQTISISMHMVLYRAHLIPHTFSSFWSISCDILASVMCSIHCHVCLSSCQVFSLPLQFFVLWRPSRKALSFS